MENPKTIKVNHPDGFMTINKDDFDPKKHKEYTPKLEKPAKKKAVK